MWYVPDAGNKAERVYGLVNAENVGTGATCITSTRSSTRMEGKGQEEQSSYPLLSSYPRIAPCRPPENMGQTHVTLALLRSCLKLLFKSRKTISTPSIPVAHYSLYAAACPRLAAKFARTHPHLFVQPDEDDNSSPPVSEARTPQQAIQGRYGNRCECKGQDCITNGLCSTFREVPSAIADVHSCSSGTMPPLNRSGTVRTVSKAPPDPHSGRGECQEKQ